MEGLDISALLPSAEVLAKIKRLYELTAVLENDIPQLKAMVAQFQQTPNAQLLAKPNPTNKTLEVQVNSTKYTFLNTGLFQSLLNSAIEDAGTSLAGLKDEFLQLAVEFGAALQAPVSSSGIGLQEEIIMA